LGEKVGNREGARETRPLGGDISNRMRLVQQCRYSVMQRMIQQSGLNTETTKEAPKRNPNPITLMIRKLTESVVIVAH